MKVPGRIVLGGRSSRLASMSAESWPFKLALWRAGPLRTPRRAARDDAGGALACPVHRESLSNIREFWIALAHESRFLNDDGLATQIETIGRLHAKLDRDTHA
jgi:hypothetical protein